MYCLKRTDYYNGGISSTFAPVLERAIFGLACCLPSNHTSRSAYLLRHPEYEMKQIEAKVECVCKCVYLVSMRKRLRQRRGINQNVLSQWSPVPEKSSRVSCFSKQTHILALPDLESLQGKTDSGMKERHKSDRSTPRELLFFSFFLGGEAHR